MFSSVAGVFECIIGAVWLVIIQLQDDIYDFLCLCLFVYVHKPRQATVALRDAGCTCHGPVFGGSGRTHGTCQKQLEPRSAACPSWQPVWRQMNFSLVNLERLALKSAATDANGWMLSWHFCSGVLHVAWTTLSAPSYLQSTLSGPVFCPSDFLYSRSTSYFVSPCQSQINSSEMHETLKVGNGITFLTKLVWKIQVNVGVFESCILLHSPLPPLCCSFW